MYYTGVSDGSAMTAAGPIKIFRIPGGASLIWGGLHSRFINECLEDELHSESTFAIAQSATESLKRLDDWEYEDSITLMFTAETDEGGEERYIHTGLSDDLCCPTQLRVIIKYRTQKNAKFHHFICYQDNIEMHFSSVISLKYWLFNQKTTT